jgi:outer membrane protein
MDAIIRSQTFTEVKQTLIIKALKPCLFRLIISLIFFISGTSYALTLDEAVSLAKENLPSYKASLTKIRSTEALYDASLAPYLPSLDASTSQKRLYTNKEFSTRTYDLTLSYTLFDGGKRRANRDIALLNLNIDKEDARKNLLELQYNIKAAFYTALAQKETVQQRKIQLQDAQKDHEVAEGRYKFGVAKLSDVLQASVRLEQARYNLIQAEGDFKKALSELNSLIGKSLDSQYDIAGSLDMNIKLPDRNKLSDIALQRPEVKQAENSMEISRSNKSLANSAFYPSLQFSTSYSKTEGGALRTSFPEEKTAGITATWNIFELGKFFKRKSAEFEKSVTTEKLNELKRNILLDVHKTYEDFIIQQTEGRRAAAQTGRAQLFAGIRRV